MIKVLKDLGFAVKTVTLEEWISIENKNEDALTYLTI